jgi:hypothetical protein
MGRFAQLGLRLSRSTRALIRLAARSITARGGCLFPSARHAATVLRKRAAIVPQHVHVLMCRSTIRRRPGISSPSRYRDTSSSNARQRGDGRVGTVISRVAPSPPEVEDEPDAGAS